MKEDINIIEETDIVTEMQFPHLFYEQNDLSSYKKAAFLVLVKKEDDILLVSSVGFSEETIFAGLTEKHIEYIAKNAPRDYKDNILKLLQDQEMMKGVFEITKAMDEDLGRGSVRNQERVRNVIQYIKDNRIAFEF